MSYITPRPDARRAPTTPAQRRDWRAHHGRSDNAFMNLSAAFTLKGPLDEGALRRAVDRLVARHEALRTEFRTDGDRLWQHVLPTTAARLPALTTEDLAEYAHHPGQAERQWAATVADRSFELETGPPARFALARTGPERAILCMVLHHIICDQTSVRIALRDLAALYTAETTAGAAPLPELTVQFPDYAHWWHERSTAGNFNRSLAHWARGLADAPAVTPLPVIPSQDRRASTYTTAMPHHTADRLAQAAARSRTTPYVLLLSAFSGALADLTGAREHLVECGYANRLSAPLWEGIGRFSNNLVLRVPTDPGAGTREQLAATHRAAMTAFAHARVSLDAVNEAALLDRQFVPNPESAVAFQLIDGFTDLLPLPGITAEQHPTAAGTILDLLSVMVERNGPDLTLRATYCPSLLATAWIEDLGRRFLARLDTLVTGVERDQTAEATA
ncbi:condensation domain-containing protein [Streptomyces sp. NPDC007205]|uniref:condensation domain-containing protein n=1 Tax=Streptomyces sp. NPDC007205 TaxID=3154316 RepID=UPI0033C86273